MGGPLEGVRVVELGIWVAAPASAAILADWGAEVIKIEEPEKGDPLRGLAATGLTPFPVQINPAFELDNRNKKSMTIDLRKEGAGKVIADVISAADVFITNFRPSKLENLSMTYEDLRKINPRLIYAGLTGYGTRGADRDRAAFDYAAFWARAGVMASLGEPDQPPPTQRPGMGDHTTALAIAGAVSAALYVRERTGEGQEIRLSLYRTGIWFQSIDIQVSLLYGVNTLPLGRRNAWNPLFNVYRTRDGRWIHLVMLQADRHWPAFCSAIGYEDLLRDERFSSVAKRVENCTSLIAILDPILESKTLEEWGEIFDRHQLFWGKVQTVGDVVQDAQARENGAFQKVQHPSGQEIELVTTPVDFVATPAEVRQAAPELGQHTEEILLGLGYSWEKIATLKEEGVIG